MEKRKDGFEKKIKQSNFHKWSIKISVTYFKYFARRAGSDGGMSASGSAGPRFDPRWGSKFSIPGIGGVEMYNY